MAAATPNAEVGEAGCPRCAYDMAGHVATWTDQCPLESECPECGLVFGWRDVLVEDRRRVPWLFEHARPGRWRLGLVRSAGATARRMILPWVFWRRVGLHHRVVVSRLLLWLLLITAGLHAAGSALAIIATQLGLDLFGTSWTLATLLNACTVPYGWWDYAPWRPAGWRRWEVHSYAPPEWTAAACAFALTWLGMVLVIPQTRARARVHGRHLLRAAVYGFSWLGLMGAVRAAEFAWADLCLMIGGAPYLVFVPSKALLSPFGLALFAAWSAAWWHAVLGRGWRIPHATRVWAVLLIPAVLAGAVAWCAAYVTAAGGW